MKDAVILASFVVMLVVVGLIGLGAKVPLSEILKFFERSGREAAIVLLVGLGISAIILISRS